MATKTKTSLVSDAYSHLKEEIRTNRLPPGYQAPEPEIALRLGMSRTPVREALIRLEAECLVELIPRRGARVLPISAGDMKDIYEILTALEPEAAANVAAREPSAEDLKPLEQATAKMERALDADDLDAWAEADDVFHATLLAINGNDRMRTFVTSLYDQAHRARIITLRLRERPVRSTEEHRMILDRLRHGDADGTRNIFRQHRERAARELLAILENYRLPQL